jgi:hypothetical protein
MLQQPDVQAAAATAAAHEPPPVINHSVVSVAMKISSNIQLCSYREPSKVPINNQQQPDLQKPVRPRRYVRSRLLSYNGACPGGDNNKNDDGEI